MFIESPRFPTGISYGASGGPNYSTDIVVVNSGYESRNQNWSMPLAAYDVAHGVKSQAQMNELIAFFRNCKGRMNAFRFKDFTDFTTREGQGVLVATDMMGVWQLTKQYITGDQTEYRTITKPVIDTVTIGGVGSYEVDYTTGLLTKTGGADPTGWTGEFDVPVRFDTDSMKVAVENYNAYTWGQIPVVEIRI